MPYKNFFASEPFFAAETLTPEEREDAKQTVKNMGDKVLDKDSYGRTLLHTIGNADVVPLLVARGLDVNECDNFGQTPLFLVQNTGKIQALIDAGADVCAIDDKGNTALMQLLKNKPVNAQAAALLAAQDYSALPPATRDAQNKALADYEANRTAYEQPEISADTPARGNEFLPDSIHAQRTSPGNITERRDSIADDVRAEVEGVLHHARLAAKRAKQANSGSNGTTHPPLGYYVSLAQKVVDAIQEGDETAVQPTASNSLRANAGSDITTVQREWDAPLRPGKEEPQH